jgi:hypothetical protein
VGKIFDAIDEKLASWIAEQRMFFVGTAPLHADGHVNVSPKGRMDTFRVLGPREAAYLDFVGSGAETLAHLRENGRIVVMLCAFEGPPRIVRLHGRGEVVQVGDGGFDELRALFAADDESAQKGARAIVRVEVTRVADSCGYGVPVLRYEDERTQFPAWVDSKLRKGGDDALAAYMAEKNAASIDGLPSVEPALLPRV